MDNDDQPVGRILTRREVLMLFGAAGAAVLAGCAPGQRSTPQPTSTATQPTAVAPTSVTTAPVAPTTPACVVKPALTEGPYFVDEKLNRSDIRSDPSDGLVKDGAPLNLTVRVSQINGGCMPLQGAQVDIWHCDARGVYSDVLDPNFGSTKGKKFLRGYQVTDPNGSVQFTTIYPGWYQGRAVHIHFKIRTDPNSSAGYEFTSQWFFDETLTDQVHTRPPYAAKGYRTLKNEGDGIYRQSGGQTVLNVAKSGDGYAATFDIGLQM